LPQLGFISHYQPTTRSKISLREREM